MSPFGPSILRDYALPILDVSSVVIGHVVYIRTGTCDVINTSTEYMEMPVKAFEMVHLHTYQSDFISTYSKAACQVDTQLALAQHAQREVRNRAHHIAVASCLSLDFDCGIYYINEIGFGKLLCRPYQFLLKNMMNLNVV